MVKHAEVDHHVHLISVLIMGNNSTNHLSGINDHSIISDLMKHRDNKLARSGDGEVIAIETKMVGAPLLNYNDEIDVEAQSVYLYKPHYQSSLDEVESPIL